MIDPREAIKKTERKDIEDAVLGALILEAEAQVVARRMINHDSFYAEANKSVFRAIESLWAEKIPVDILTVVDRLKNLGLLESIGGAYYVSQLTNRVGSSANIEYHCVLLKESEITRKQISLSVDIMNQISRQDYDPISLNERISTLAYECSNIGNLKKERSLSDIGKELTKRMQSASDKELTGVPSGHNSLDKITGGWQKSDLIILAARPGMGKTALMLCWAIHEALVKRIPVGVFSIEMKDTQLFGRLMSQQSHVDSNKIRTGKLSDADWIQYHNALGLVEKMPMTLVDDPDIHLGTLEAKAMELHMQGRMEIMFVDYLQMIEVKGSKAKNREQEIAKVSRSLKQLAKKLDIPIVALSQLSRSVESRGGDKRPMLSDLRESGAIEQDADMVMFLYRPEYYGITEDVSGMPTNGMALLDVAKHRNGSLEEVVLRFLSSLTKFEDWNKVEENAVFGAIRPDDDF